MKDLRNSLFDLVRQIKHSSDRPSRLKYCGNFEFVAIHGHEFEQMDSALEVGRIKRCFENALFLVFDNPELVYCEGFALSTECPIPIHHAWVANSEGKAFEVTWDIPGTDYLGIPFDRVFVAKTVRTKGSYGLIDYIVLHDSTWIGHSDYPRKRIANK